MEQIQKHKQVPQEESVEGSTDTPNAQADLSATDDLLDEIDAVLEENAAEFIRDYIQKGGE